MEDALESTVRTWQREGLGVQCGNNRKMTHIIWADNIWLVARTREELRRLQEDVAKASEAKSLWWKDSSLKFMSTEGPIGDMVTNG